MIGAIIGAAIAAGSAIAGGISSAKRAKESEAILNSQIEDLNYWYDVESSKDFLDSETAKSTLRLLDTQNRQSQEKYNNQTVSQGNTAEANVALASALNKNYADALAELSSKHYAYQDGLESRYQNELNALLAEKKGVVSNKATTSSTIGSVGSAIGSNLALLEQAGSY